MLWIIKEKTGPRTSRRNTLSLFPNRGDGLALDLAASPPAAEPLPRVGTIVRNPETTLTEHLSLEPPREPPVWLLVWWGHPEAWHQKSHSPDRLVPWVLQNTEKKKAQSEVTCCQAQRDGRKNYDPWGLLGHPLPSPLKRRKKRISTRRKQQEARLFAFAREDRFQAAHLFLAWFLCAHHDGGWAGLNKAQF